MPNHQGHPTSDPTPPSRQPGKPATPVPDTPSHERGIDAIPTGYPTSDRHAAETAHQWENQEQGVEAAKDLNPRDVSSDAAEAKTRSSSRP